MKFAYVVLHYRTYDLTVDCVSNLARIAPQSPVVVVDNGSGDGSGERLRDFFISADSVHVLLSPSNLGFASGNNLGYAYACEHFDPDFVVVMNNDVMISQPDFEQLMADFMSAEGVDVCGPDILTPDGGHQNPLLTEPFSSFRIFKQMAIDSVRLLCLRLGIFQKRILGTYSSVSSSYHRKEAVVTRAISCIPHGACLVFSRRYIDRMPYAFEPVTFLFCEEMILHDLCRHMDFRTAVCPEARVLHLGGKSTMADAGQRQRQIFKISQTLRSMWSLLKLRMFKNYSFLRNNNTKAGSKSLQN